MRCTKKNNVMFAKYFLLCFELHSNHAQSTLLKLLIKLISQEKLLTLVNSYSSGSCKQICRNIEDGYVIGKKNCVCTHHTVSVPLLKYA